MSAWRVDARNRPLVSDFQYSIEELVLLLTPGAGWLRPRPTDSVTHLTLPHLPRGMQNSGALINA